MNWIKSSGFWIVNCNTTVKSFISRCVTCRRLRGNLQLQKMASQPCLSSQTIHIEAANSLSTYCFLMCLRRFIGQRENVRLIRSDNGTNFVGASAELTKISQK